MRTTLNYFLFYLASTLLLSTVSMGASAEGYRTRLHQVLSNKNQADDIRAEIRFGKQVAARILGRESLYEDTRLTHYINLVGHALVLHSNRNELNFHFAILNKDYPNAYSTPGGYVFITLGAIQLCRDEAELAAVLGHEIAHITQKHIVNDLNIQGRDRSNMAGLTRLLGAYGDSTRIALSQAVDKAITILFKDGYQTNQELEADKVATLLLAETGYDPMALQRYLDRISKTIASESSQQQTHPPSSIRFSSLAALIEKESLNTLSYPALKQRFIQYTGNQK